jgi:reactive intermediate/imine deaminase
MKNLLLVLCALNLATPIVTLACGEAQNTKQAINTKNAPAPIGAYSQAIKIGKTVYISGQIPIDVKTGNLVEGDFNAQFTQAVLNVSEITKAAGGSLDSIVKLTIYIADLNNFATVNTVMNKYFHEPYPARAVVQISKLPKNAAVEIEAVME